MPARLRIIEELSTDFFEDEFRYHQFMVQKDVVEQFVAHTGATDMRRNQYRGNERDSRLGIDAAGLGARNQFGPKRSKLSHPQVAPQRLAHEVALGNSESGTLAFDGLIQFIRDT